MKKLLCISSSLFLIFSSFLYFGANSKAQKPYLSACWSTHYDNIEEMTEQSTIVVKGKVESTYTLLRGDVVFTINQCVIEESLSDNIQIGDVIDVLQTGGTYGDIFTPEIIDAPLLKQGDSYLLYLEGPDKVNDSKDNYYQIAGGYQGYANVENDESIEPISQNNNLFDSEIIDNDITNKKNNNKFFKQERKNRKMSMKDIRNLCKSKNQGKGNQYGKTK